MRANAAIKKLFCKNMQDRIRYMYERLPEKIARSVNQYPARALPWLPSLSRPAFGSASVVRPGASANDCKPVRLNSQAVHRGRQRATDIYFTRHPVFFESYDQRLRRGFPNSDGISSSRNKSSCALTPIERLASPLSGTIASAATCQLTATYDRPGFIVAVVFSPRGETKENSTRGTNWFSGSSFGSLPGVNLSVR
jgi:hypothetical protein